MAARLGWNVATIPNGMSFFDTNDTDENHYDTSYNGAVADILSGVFSLQAGVNRDGGVGAVVWTPTWLPVVADPSPTIAYFGSVNQFFKTTGGQSGPPIHLYNGELQMRATLAGVPLPGYLRLVVTSDPDYGSAQWQWVSDVAPVVCDFVGTPLVGAAPLSVQFTDLTQGLGDIWPINEDPGSSVVLSETGLEANVPSFGSAAEVIAEPTTGFDGNVIQSDVVDGGVSGPFDFGAGFTVGVLRLQFALQAGFVPASETNSGYLIDHFDLNLQIRISVSYSNEPRPNPMLQFWFDGTDWAPNLYEVIDDVAHDLAMDIGPTNIVILVDEVVRATLSRATIGFPSNFSMSFNVGRGLV